MRVPAVRPLELPALRRALALAVVLAALMSGSMAFAAADANATRLYVRHCYDVSVRTEPGAGGFVGTLYTNQSIEVDRTWRSPSGLWFAHGFAYGYVNNWGWVQLNCLGS